MLVAALFRFIGEGIPIILITRHAANLPDTLKKFRLESIFDDVIHVAEDHEKALLINRDGAIFIDDSFSERKQVSEVCGIPVFSPQTVEQLV